MKPTRRQVIAAGLGAIAGPTAADAPRSAPRGKFREFAVIVRSEDPIVYAGWGMTLDRVVDAERDLFEHSRAFEVARGHDSNSSFVADWPSMVVWEGFRAVALLRAGHDGSLEVTRFDGGGAGR